MVLRAFVRLILSILRKFRSELRHFKKSIRDIIQHFIDKGVHLIQLKYNCLQVRKRMCKVNSYQEWESYARLLDHLEGTVDWKYRANSRVYDFARIEARR